MDEMFKKIDGQERYEVSSIGRVRNSKTGRYLIPLNVDRGYLTVVLYCNGKSKRFYIHRLVAIAFVEHSEGKKEVNHLDCNKTNNDSTNLKWVTPSENIRYSLKNTQWKLLRSDNTSGYRGVCWNSLVGKCLASIKRDGKSKHLGFFTSKEAAAKVYDNAVMQAFGNQSMLNFPK